MMKTNTLTGIAMAALMAVSLGLTGCDKSKDTAPAATTAVETKQDSTQPAATPAKEHPASTKPKDHPAH